MSPDLLSSRVPDGPVFLAEVSFSPPHQTRFFVLKGGGEAMSTVTSVSVATGEAETLVRRLGADRDVILGHCDAMAATTWEHAWFRIGETLRLWSRGGQLRAVADPSGIVVHRLAWLGIRRRTCIETGSIAAVHVSVSPGWERHDVELVTRDGQHHPIAHKVDRTVWMDPTYDGLNLLADTRWATDLARALADTCTVPVTTHNL